MQFSPIETPFSQQEMICLIGGTKREYEKDRRAGFICHSCYHNGRDSKQFSLPNTFDIFSYTLFKKILPRHWEDTKKFDCAEHLTDYVAFFAEHFSEPWPADQQRSLEVNGIEVEIQTWSDANNCYLGSFNENSAELAQTVYNTWVNCLEAAFSIVECEHSGNVD